MAQSFTGITQEIVSGVALGCIYALIALGFTLIYKATEVVNFAQGELMMVGAFVNFYLVSQLAAATGLGIGLRSLLGLAGALLFSIFFGALLDLLINRPLKDESVFSIIMLQSAPPSFSGPEQP